MFFYLPCPSRLASQGYIFFHISLNFLEFYLPRMLVEFSVTCICQHLWEKIFNLWCHIPRKSLNLCFFSLMPQSPTPFPPPAPHSKLPVEIFENVSPKTEGVEEAMICYVKIQSENMQMTWNISLFPFDMITIFLNVMTLKFCK